MNEMKDYLDSIAAHVITLNDFIEAIIEVLSEEQQARVLEIVKEKRKEQR